MSSRGKPFFEKENILILRIYQLYLASTTTKCPKDTTNAHNPSKKEDKNKMSYYGEQNVVHATQTTA
jgi:hypothetical protein